MEDPSIQRPEQSELKKAVTRYSVDFTKGIDQLRLAEIVGKFPK